jgi:hypothetical protein
VRRAGNRREISKVKKVAHAIESFASRPVLVGKSRRGTPSKPRRRNKRAIQVEPKGKLPVSAPDLAKDTLYRAKAVGCSTDGRAAADHDSLLLANY